MDEAKEPDEAASEYLKDNYYGDWGDSWKDDLMTMINDSYLKYLERFRLLKPNSSEPAVLNFLREVLIAGGISTEELQAWEAEHGVGGGGTGYLFGPPSTRVTERTRLKQDLDVAGAPRTVRAFQQLATPNRRSARDREARVLAVTDPWLDDNS
jgi:hypothetical protein